MANIAFVGLGAMGWPMARHLVNAGHRLHVSNRTFAKAQAFGQAHGVAAFATAAEAAAGMDVLITCVGNDDDVRQVTTGPEGGFQTLAPGALFIDHSTASAQLARELEAAAPHHLVVDAPVSGGQAGAENGQLSAMCGGQEAAFEAARPILSAYAQTVVRIGPAGHGQLAKMVNQICIAGLVQGLSEAMHFLAQSGLDADPVLSAIGKGAAQSWQMDNRARSMLERRFDFGFAIDLMRKDLGLVLDEARSNGARLPVTALVDQFYGDVQKMGGGRHDTSALICRLI